MSDMARMVVHATHILPSYGPVPCTQLTSLLLYWQVPFHMAKGISYLLLEQCTFHIGLEVLKVFRSCWPTWHPHSLARAAQHLTAQHSTLSTAVSVAAQLSSSGLLQQLPSVLQRAQQQLSSLDAFGYCGVECEFCSTEKAVSGGHGVAVAALAPPQARLLGFCSHVIKMWPGGPLSSVAVGPILVPAAELAVCSLQTATRLVQERPDSSTAPSEGMRQLGNAALDICFSVCSAAQGCQSLEEPDESAQPSSSSASSTDARSNSSSHHRSSSSGGRSPCFAKQLLEHPVMLSAAVIVACSAVYREHLIRSIREAQARKEGMAKGSAGTATSSDGSSSSEGATPGHTAGTPFTEEGFFCDLFNAFMYQTVPVGLLSKILGHGPAAAWQLLSTQESQLSAGQSLLPDLQQQLLSTLGCNAKAFLWLSAACDKSDYPWQGMESHQLLETVGSAVLESCSAKLSAQQQQIQLQELQQVLLLPALLLRWAVHKQQHKGYQLGGMYCTITSAVWFLRIMPCWRRLVVKASKQQEQPQQLQKLLQGWHALQGQSGKTQFPAAVLYELLLLSTHLLQRVVDATPGFSTVAAAEGYKLDDYQMCRPESVVDALATAVGALLPAATTMLLGEANTLPVVLPV